MTTVDRDQLEGPVPGMDESAARQLVIQALDTDQTAMADEWVRRQRARSPLPLTEDDLRREADELLTALRTALKSPTPAASIVDQDEAVREALTALSDRRVRTGTPPSATAMAILGLKRAVLAAAERHTDDPALCYQAALLVNEVLDGAGVLTFAAYAEGREEIIRQQHSQMLELTTPVVRLWRQVLAVPLIGTLDSARTQIVMTGLLEAIQTHQARIAIIDITGVPTVDTAVAQHLLQTASAVRLMGAECVISGIRPSIAQTITQLGIDLSHILTRSSLADALAAALRILGEEPGRAAG